MRRRRLTPLFALSEEVTRETLHIFCTHTSHSVLAGDSFSNSHGLNHDRMGNGMTFMAEMPSVSGSVGGLDGPRRENYVFVTPVEVDSDGGYLSHDVSRRGHRSRRSLSSSLHYRLSAFGHDMHLDLRPSAVVGPGFTVQALGPGGISVLATDDDHEGFRNCLYQGFVRNLSASSVAVSTCSGLELSGPGRTHTFLDTSHTSQNQVDTTQCHKNHTCIYHFAAIPPLTSCSRGCPALLSPVCPASASPLVCGN
ncbi:unnamed protein product [Menidia menidia]|uniref:(Atlantic silverside) hypothetical protein n=1 Tax=Menidia menidia TaxID=238744 RepID=A0A8S4A5S2_9TELE|nr:unnamed protein product [Menidia menidia]